MNYKEHSSVALIFGGRGYERDVSVKGADFVYGLLKNEPVDLHLVYISREGIWLSSRKAATPSEIASEDSGLDEVYPVCQNGAGGFLCGADFTRISAAIPLLHGNYGEDGTVQGALECARIPYVGCDASVSAVARDKAYVKAIARGLGIPTVDWIVANDSLEELKATVESRIGYPAFLKPCRLGSSIGASVVRCVEDLNAAYLTARALTDRIIIEGYVEIEKELECAYFSAKGKELFTKAGEINCSGHFYDYELKYTNAEKIEVSDTSDLSERDEKLIESYSKRLVSELGIRDISRIDYFLTKSGDILFNEINTFPGFTNTSLYPRLVAKHGITPRELILSLIEECMKRNA